MLFSPVQRLVMESSKEPMGIKMAVFGNFFGMAGALSSILASFFYDGTLSALAYLLVGLVSLVFLFKQLGGKVAA